MVNKCFFTFSLIFQTLRPINSYLASILALLTNCLSDNDAKFLIKLHLTQTHIDMHTNLE